jgi:hypothetical protein
LGSGVEGWVWGLVVGVPSGAVTSGVNFTQNQRFEFPYDVVSASSPDPVEDATVLGIQARAADPSRRLRTGLVFTLSKAEDLERGKQLFERSYGAS